MIEIDGSEGEGGGQVLRSALALSICTRRAFRIVNIRAKRSKPGLMRQHLTAVRAAAEICDADLVGAEIASREVTFRPGRVRPGKYTFKIGTGGSCTLVLQTVLMPLALAEKSSEVLICGGTHNKAAPPVDFLQRAFLPLLERMGMSITLDVHRYGFYPKGGGKISGVIEPAQQLHRLDLNERGERTDYVAEAYVAGLPIEIAQRELEVIGKSLDWGAHQLKLRGLEADQGPGNAVSITLGHEQVSEVITGFGERGVRAEHVAEAAAREARSYLSRRAPVGEHLADQLLLPMALGAGGAFTTTACSEHLRTNAKVVETFIGKAIGIVPVEDGYRVEVEGRRQ